MTDLTYVKDKMFTSFIAQSPDGETAWREMANKMNGAAKVFNFEAHNIITQLRRAGYKVTKAKKVTQKEMNEIFTELEALGV